MGSRRVVPSLGSVIGRPIQVFNRGNLCQIERNMGKSRLGDSPILVALLGFVLVFNVLLRGQDTSNTSQQSFLINRS